ncbi:unnamed protein product [Brassica rapa]|uniref:Uncharacterized protein n=1 Tax=Brassica campestris TaxID=3711 RepID=A0A8D9H8J3_BRACM|nr:unnamed protein product [Brassica rapa]
MKPSNENQPSHHSGNPSNLEQNRHRNRSYDAGKNRRERC